MIGPPLFCIFSEILSRLGRFDPSFAMQLVTEYREQYALEAAHLTSVVPGVPRMLEAVSERGATLFVCTSKPQEPAADLLQCLRLSRWFFAIIGPQLSAPSEPKVDTLRRALRTADTITSHARAPELRIMIGDRHHDITAGRANGVPTIGVTWGSGSRNELLLADCDAIVNAPDEVPDAVARISNLAAEKTTREK